MLILFSLSPCLCIAKENESTNQHSKPKTSLTEKKKKESKNKNSQEEKNNSKENKNENEPNSNSEASDQKKEKSKKEKQDNKPYAPKMNSIIPEKPENESQTSSSNENIPTAGEAENFNLPEIEEIDINGKTHMVPQTAKESRSIPKTIISWCLILLGIMTITAAIILNSKIPNGVNFKYHEKHNKKHVIHNRKNKYRLKYK